MAARRMPTGDVCPHPPHTSQPNNVYMLLHLPLPNDVSCLTAFCDLKLTLIYCLCISGGP